MSAEPAIRAEGLGKRYRLGTPEQYGVLRDALADAWSGLSRAVTAPFRGGASTNGARREERRFLWALKDVSFEVPSGCAVGIIGPNGAGKSTLLKILSRITEPSEGRVEVRGRLGSLLEVGTGFHPELTGRENIFLNGAILGMRRSEILRKFDEIVAFAELERFIDTPVKRYSSGMYLRLAFSVAAHLDFDILAVDEVLAVGDVAFQRKCLGKMEEVRGRQGRTVLFVSHNLGSIRLLTETCLLMDAGRLAAFGKTEDTVTQYLQTSFPVAEAGVVDLTGSECRRGTTKRPALDITFESLRLLNREGLATGLFFEREPISVELAFRSTIAARSLEFILVIMTMEGSVVCSCFSGPRTDAPGPGRFLVTCEIDPNILRPSAYRLRLYLRSGTWQDIIAEAATFRVEPNPAEEYEMSYASTNPGLMGAVRVESRWGAIQPR
jgi:lipopolysaccharide transport system ATP-binding protein